MHISELDLTAKKIKELNLLKTKKPPQRIIAYICMVKVMTFILEMFVT